MVIMEENHELPGRLEKGSQPAEFGFKARVDDGHIHFRHPVTQENVRLPMNYSGARLTIDGKLYDLPGEHHGARQDAAKNVWY